MANAFAKYLPCYLSIDPAVPAQSPAMSSAAIIGIVIASILLVLLVLDITCFCINRIGLIALCCNSKSKKSDEEDPKLGSWRFPLPYCSYKAAPAHPSSLNLPQPIKFVPSPTGELLFTEKFYLLRRVAPEDIIFEVTQPQQKPSQSQSYTMDSK
ncbi:hypothetical protein NQ315_015539 [Exocentrus adspersus]|uniref:Uncharacterized protein n=1 Tax=Exocentrus adspersus TaxID=1586481 RepID=A0AAV8VP38_9CUCU|nr:hypothetical protein NQ315_015539 [Exocentrus adspersus]